MGYESRANERRRRNGVIAYRYTRVDDSLRLAGSRLVSDGDAPGRIVSRDGRIYYYDGISLRRWNAPRVTVTEAA